MEIFGIDIFEAIRYVLVGGTCAVLELLIFMLFYKQLGLPTLVANSLAFFIVLAVGFILQKHWTFKNESKEYKKQATKFFIITGIGFLLNNGLVYLFIDVLKMLPLIGKFIQLWIVLFWNFFGQKLWVFKNEHKNA